MPRRECDSDWLEQLTDVDDDARLEKRQTATALLWLFLLSSPRWWSMSELREQFPYLDGKVVHNVVWKMSNGLAKGVSVYCRDVARPLSLGTVKKRAKKDLPVDTRMVREYAVTPDCVVPMGIPVEFVIRALGKRFNIKELL